MYKVGNHEKYKKKWNFLKKVSVSEKKSAPIPILKLDLGFGRTLFCIAIIEIAHRRPYIQWLIHETLPLFCRQKCVQHSLQMQCTQWGLTLCRKVAVFVHRWFDKKKYIFRFSNFYSSFRSYWIPKRPQKCFQLYMQWMHHAYNSWLTFKTLLGRLVKLGLTIKFSILS